LKKINSRKISIINSQPNQSPTEQVTTRRYGRKNIYITLAAISAITIIVVAVMFVPQGNANVIVLGVNYKVGEKLTYLTTATVTTNSNGATVSTKTNSSTTIQVLNFVGDTYTLNFTTTKSSIGYNYTDSKIIELKNSQIVTAIALLPITSTGYSVDNSTSFTSAVFDKSQAKVGDKWTIPLTSSDSTISGSMEITFKAIQNLKVVAGTYKVFRMDFTITPNGTIQNSADLFYKSTMTGQTYLESDTCKQIQSSVQYVILNPYGNKTNYKFDISYSSESTLTQDQKP
jgi:hypothetical protein